METNQPTILSDTCVHVDPSLANLKRTQQNFKEQEIFLAQPFCQMMLAKLFRKAKINGVSDGGCEQVSAWSIVAPSN